jgi:hypothetical protein
MTNFLNSQNFLFALGKHSRRINTITPTSFSGCRVLVDYGEIFTMVRGDVANVQPSRYFAVLYRPLILAVVLKLTPEPKNPKIPK